MSNANTYRLATVLLVFGLIWGRATGQVMEPSWVEVWPNDTGSVTVGDTLNLQWAPPTGQSTSYGMRDLIILRNDPWAQDSLIAQDVKVRLRIKATMNPDHGLYRQSGDRDTLFLVDLKMAIRGSDLYPAGLDSALATINSAAYAFSDAHKVQVVLDSVWVDAGSGWQTKSSIPVGLFLELEITWLQTPYSSLTEIPDGLLIRLYDCNGLANTSTAQELEFNWLPIANMEAYDLEWTWVDNYQYQSGSWNTLMPPANIEYNFTHDATRVTIPVTQGAPHYRIPLIYDSGYIIWRVRGAKRSMGNPSAWVFTNWSPVPVSANVQDAIDVDPDFVKEIPSHQGGKNWQASRSYAEDGKHKEVVTYADGTLRTRQVVTRNNTLGAPIVGETVYDAIGRPAVQVMPVPSIREGCVGIGADNWGPIEYKPNFNQEDSTGGPMPFTWADLTGNDCAITAPNLDSISGAQYYYSGAYAEEVGPLLVPPPSFLPRADGLPYSQTEYTRDKTGRIRSQGGVGPAFQLGMHDTKYYYGAPLQLELDRLFGSEAGYAIHYQKNVIVDANSQVSVSYLDMAGRTVATALACGAPGSMDPLETNVPVELTNDLFSGLASTDSSAQMRQDGPALVFTKQIPVPCTGEYTFDYNLDTKVVSVECSELCAHCVYELSIQLTDQCGAIIPLKDQDHNDLFGSPMIVGSLNGDGEFMLNCTGTFYPANGLTILPVTLDAGEYTLTKTLRIHAPARNYYVEELLLPENSSCILDSAHFATEALQGLDDSGCYQSCDQCYDRLGSLEYFVGLEGGRDADQYWILMAQCDEICKAKSWCDVAYDNMIADMMPNSQYGMIEFGPDGGQGGFAYSAPDLTSVFHSIQNNLLMMPFANSSEPWRLIDQTRAAWQQPLMETETGWREGYYLSDGERLPIQVYENGQNGFIPEIIANSQWEGAEPGTWFVWPENLANLNDFIINWQTGWERSLVRFHPEYCYYRDCKGYSELIDPDDVHSSSDGFDALLNLADTYAEAIFIDNDDPHPLLSAGPPVTFNYAIEDAFVYAGGSYAQALQNKVNSYLVVNNTSYSMLQVAAATTKCGGNLNGGPGCVTFCDLSDGDDLKNAQWITLKSFYQSEKYRIQKHKADDFVSTCDCGGLNVCIGEDRWQDWWSRVTSYPYPIPGVWASQPAYMWCQPCNVWRDSYFSDKVRRVPEPDMIGPVNNAMDAAYQLFLQTGQCPIGTAWQGVFQQLFTQTNFNPNGTYLLNDYPSWLGVYTALNDLELVATAPEAHAVFTQSGSVLSMIVDYTDPSTSDCQMTLTLPNGVLWDTVQVTYVAQINVDNGPGNFQLGLYYTDDYGVSGNVYVPGTGMCHALAPCNFPPDCNPNELAMQFQELFNLMAAVGQLDGNALLSTTQVPPAGNTDPTIQSILGPSLTSHFPPGADLRWEYVAAPEPQLLLINNATATKRFRLDHLFLAEPQPASLTLAQCLAQAAYLHNINSAFTNNFVVEVYDATNTLLGHLSGKAWFEDDGTLTPMPLGSCGLPPSINCEGDGYRIVRDLVAVLGEWVPAHWPQMDQADLWESPMMNSGLALALCPSCENIGEGLVAEGSASSVLIGDCLGLSIVFDPGHTSFNSLGDATLTAPMEGGEVWHGMQFPLYNNGSPVGYLIVEASCLDLLVCDPCPQDTTGDMETQGNLNLASYSDNELLAMGYLHYDTLYANYVHYKEAIDSLNTRLGLAPYDSSYVQAATYAGYRKLGMQHAVNVYLHYIRNFRPELDRSLLLQYSGKFVAEYGNAVNVDEEYKRYVRVVADYNGRADSAGKPTMEMLPDSLFRELLYADKAALYIANLVDMPPLEDLPLGMQDFFDLYGDSPSTDVCTDLYRYSYLPAYKWFEAHNNDSTARCPDFRKYSPLVSMEEFRASNLCCSDSGQVILTAYLQQFYNDTLKCPSALPRLKVCPEPLEIVLKEEERECQNLYNLWIEAMKDYKESLYGTTQGYPLPFEDISFQTFMNEKWCTCVRDYLQYLQPWLDWPGSYPKPPPPLHIKDFCNKPCKESHIEWLALMGQYNLPCAYVEHWGHALPIEELEDYGKFVEAHLCSCVEGYNAYIQAYINWHVGEPLLPVPQSIVDFCSGDSVDCCTMVDSLKPILAEVYPNSIYRTRFPIDLPFNWSGCEEMQELGYCVCLPDYLSYLSDYLVWTPDSTDLPPVLSLEEFCNNVPVGTPCANSYRTYTVGLQSLMPLVDAVNDLWPTSNYQFGLADESLFTSSHLCYCVESYLADAELALSVAVATHDEALLTHWVFNIIRHCETPHPCPPPPLFPVIPTITITQPECLCCDQLEAGAIGDADIQYHQYLDTLVNDLTARYDSACLTALEHFTLKAPNSEYHYTLYYYDQAGNLVRTVPPAGVEPLPITSSNDPVAIEITQDRENGTHSVIMAHRMASDHLYNSLEQPTRTLMPDQDRMDIWQTSLNHGLPSFFKITGSWFGEGGIGYVSGYRDIAGKTRGYAYRTADGGRTWQRSTGLLGEDLNDVHFPDVQHGYAVGTHGAFLRSFDSGSSWDLVPNQLLGEGHELTALSFSTATNGLVLGLGGYWGTTANSGIAFANLNLPLAGQPDFTGAGFDGSAYQASASTYQNIANGAVLALPQAGAPWDLSGAFGSVEADLACAAAFGSDRVRIGGNNGVLLENKAPATDQWRMLPTGTADGFRAMTFLNDARGIAIMDSLHNGIATGIGVLRYTMDHGRHWLPIGLPTYNLSSMAEYDRTATSVMVVAVGTGGTVLRVVLSMDTVGIIPMSGLSNVDLTAVWAQRPGDHLRCFVGTSIGNVFSTAELGLGQQASWTNSNLSPGGSIRSITARDSMGIVACAVALNTNGARVDIRFKYQSNQTWKAQVAAGGDAAALVSTTDAAIYRNAAFETVSLGGIPPFVDPLSPVTPVNGPVNAPRSFLPVNGGIWSTGQGGELFMATYPGYVWSNRSNAIRPLPLNAMDKAGQVAVGDQGLVYKNTTGGWRSIPTGRTANLHAVSVDLGNAAVAGENGVAFTFNVGNPAVVQDLNVPVSTPLSAVSLKGNAVLLGGGAGTLLRTTNAGYTDPTLLSSFNGGKVNALASTGSGDLLIAVGTASMVQQVAGANRTPVLDVFTPRLNAVDFSSGTNGYVVGDNQTARHTSDGGQHWSTVPMPSQPNAPGLAFNAVKAEALNKATAVGNSGLAADFNAQTWSATSISATGVDLLAVAISESGIGVIVGEAGSSGRYFTRNANATAWSTATNASHALHAVWSFPRINSKEEFLLGGENSTLIRLEFNANGQFSNDFIPQDKPGTSEDIRGFWFHDHLSGFALCGNNKLYRTDIESSTLSPQSLAWQSVPMNPGLNDNLLNQAVGNVNAVTMGFSDRHHGFIGGSYSGLPESYARTITDETGLYSQRFWYDALGRIILSQNTKQFSEAPKRYSYSLYDGLGRVYEAGEVDDSDNTFRELAGAMVGGASQPSVLDPETVKAWVELHAAPHRREVTRTKYDEALAGIGFTPTFTQDNLRLRVASTTHQETFSPDPLTFDHATHYSYDIHGNVKTLVQDIPQMGSDADLGLPGNYFNHRWKRLDYTYDLISGNVKQVDYSGRSQHDQMHHRYQYDADNRIETVETSADKTIWHTDAEYFYYPHGPLERVELGEPKVQGIDYAHTLQGWLKAINGDKLVPTNDMGHDGWDNGDPVEPNPHMVIARDAYGESIGYYGDTDYQAIDPDRWENTNFTRPVAPVGTLGTFASSYSPLYNGNIAHTVNSLEPFASWTSPTEQGQVLAQVYKYDQLNRLKKAQGVAGMAASNTWHGVNDAEAHRYRSTYNYDANGNISSADRYDNNSNRYDALEYRYQQNLGGKKVNNRLYQLLDVADQPNLWANDVQDLPFQAIDIVDAMNVANHVNVKNNYSYDAIGNLVKDSLQEIQHIQWTVAGKVKHITRTPGSTKPEMTFNYGADGQRVSKTVGDPLAGGFREYYIRDAQGNIMATYRYTNTGSASLKVTDRPIYGSKRLGSYTRSFELVGETFSTDIYVNYVQPMNTRLLHYELNDHLGNVTAVVTGRLLPGAGAGSPYQAELLSAQGYEAFGSLLPGRNYSSDSYRFGFQGQEKDDEVYGATGTSYAFEYRMHDARVGRFLSIDPLAAKYAYNSPYAFSENRVIDGRELEGKEWEQYMMRRIVETKGVTALKVITADHGSGPVVDATYNLQVKSDQSTFDRLKSAYAKDPGIIHNPNNTFAQYKPIKNNAGNNQLQKGDYLDIDILGGVFKDYVVLTDVQVNGSSFSIKASTLYGHTDAGTIEFSGTFNKETGIIDFSIHNITTTNVGSDIVGFGRFAQTEQWKQVMQNVQDFINGEVKDKTVTKDIYRQGAQSGDGVKVVIEDMQSGSTTEEYKAKD